MKSEPTKQESKRVIASKRYENVRNNTWISSIYNKNTVNFVHAKRKSSPTASQSDSGCSMCLGWWHISLVALTHSLKWPFCCYISQSVRLVRRFYFGLSVSPSLSTSFSFSFILVLLTIVYRNSQCRKCKYKMLSSSNVFSVCIHFRLTMAAINLINIQKDSEIHAVRVSKSHKKCMHRTHIDGEWKNGTPAHRFAQQVRAACNFV